MQRLKILILSILLTISLTGCIQLKSEVYLNEDGSGEVKVTECITSEGLLVLQGLKATGQIPDIDYVSSITEIDEKELTQRVEDLTDGLTFKSAEQATFPDGSVGRISVYSFTDISEVKVYDENKQNSIIDMNYQPGKLTINTEIEEDEFDQMIEGMEEIEKLPQQIRPFFKGMKASLILKTPEKISQTNALYPLKDDSGIILIDLDLGEIVNSPSALAALKNFSFELQEGAFQKDKGFDYFKVEPQEKIIVEF